MTRRALLAALLVLAGLGLAGSGRAEAAEPRRVALVVGNGAYRSVERLKNPANDARLIASTLKNLGFELVGGGPQIDLDKAALSQAVQAFGRAVQGADVALFYYSGHGLQVQGVNWLVPIDASPSRPQDLDFQMVDADLVLRQMDGSGTRLNVVILDACRNNPFAISGLRGVGGGLAEMRAPEGTLISYATQPGSVARDGGGQNSPYTEALAATMHKPGLDIFQTFNRVGLQVKRVTGGEQQPWVSNSPIDGDFAFTPLPAPGPAPQTAALVQPLPAPPVLVPAPPPPPAKPATPTLPTPALATPTLPTPAPTPPPPPVHAALPTPAIAHPTARKPVPVVSRAPSSHCADVIARAQLGEPLSPGEQASLASGCGR